MYDNPLEQTITTNKYIKRHIDLIAEDSPSSATASESESWSDIDTLMSYTGDETKDGGQTPGPFEEMRRRMAESEIETPQSKKRKRKEKKRKWRWTINGDGDEGESPSEMTPTNKLPLTAMQKTPVTSIWRGASVESDVSHTSGASQDVTDTE